MSGITSEPSGDRAALNLRWLIRLRWGAVTGQALVILGVERWLALDLPLGPLFVIVGIEAASNVAVDAHFRRKASRGESVGELTVAGVMALDVVLLTALLTLSGGSFNPFNFLYLVHIALAAVVLRPRTTWGLVVLSLACFGSLFAPIDLGGVRHLDHASMMDIHLQGMWLAFMVAALFIVYFVGHVRRALEEREQQLQKARERTARSEKLASLATLAAGAAHELSTPLSTIHLVAKEMATQLEMLEGESKARLSEDAQLIREQVSRCREILEQMSDEAGASRGEPPQSVSVGDLLERVVGMVERAHPVEVDVADDCEGRQLLVPARATAQALKGLVDNACDASDDGDAAVRLSARVADDRCVIEIEDDGSGMPEAVLARAGEPFYTTKEPGQGMGLGLFLARTVTERIGGSLAIESTRGEGTVARVVLPTNAATKGRIVPNPAGG